MPSPTNNTEKTTGRVAGLAASTTVDPLRSAPATGRGVLTHQERRVRRAEMAVRVGHGDSPAVVAMEYGVSLATVTNACKELGISNHKAAPKLSKSEKRRQIVVSMLRDGASVQDASRRFGLSPGTIKQYARDAGVGLPDKRKIGSVVAVLAELINTNDTLCDIASRIGVSRERVRQISQEARERGIEHCRRTRGTHPGTDAPPEGR